MQSVKIAAIACSASIIAAASIAFIIGQLTVALGGSAVSSISSSLPLAATASNVIYGGCGTELNGNATAAMSDNMANSYATAITTGVVDFFSTISAGSVVSTGVPFTLTCTADTATMFPGIVAAEYSGSTVTSDGTSGATGSGTSVTCGSITTTNPNDVIVATITGNSGGGLAVYTAGSGFTVRAQLAVAGQGSIAFMDNIVTSTGTYSPTATIAVSLANWTCSAAAYKASALASFVKHKGHVF